MILCAEMCCSIDNLLHVKLILQANRHSMSVVCPLQAKAQRPVDTCSPSGKCLQKAFINMQDEILSRERKKEKKNFFFKSHLSFKSLQGRNPICFKQR